VIVGCGRAQPVVPLQPVATIKDIMDAIVDPSADVVWESVETVTNAAGTEDKRPRTDEEWHEVRNNAIRIIEATNLIIMDGRRVARSGERAENPSIERQPEEIEAAINHDKVTFYGLAAGLRDAASHVLDAIDRKDPEALINAGGVMDMACENCHLKYWYPADKGQQP